jgi:hypothetical protein
LIPVTPDSPSASSPAQTIYSKYHSFFPPQTITSIVALAISASLVDYYNNNGYPAIDGDYKPRIRIVLVASVWMAFFSSESRASI